MRTAVPATGSSSRLQSGTTSSSTRATQVRELNRNGVEQMRQGALESSLSTLHLALSMTTDIVAPGHANSGVPPAARSSTKGASSAKTDEGDEADAELVAARATTLSNLGCLYRRMGQLSEAMHHLQAARDLESSLQTDATGVSRSGSCSTMLNLCTVLIAMDRVEEALSVAYRCAERAAADAAAATEAADAASATFGSSKQTQEQQASASTAAYLHALSLHNLAVAQQSSEKKDERRHASTTMLNALDVARTSLGDQHPTTVMLRVKCGVPNIPQVLAATTSPATNSLVPRAPGGARPVGGLGSRASASRTEVDAARDALRQLGGSAVYEPIPQRAITSAPEVDGGVAQHLAKSPSNQQLDPADVMRGAAFTEPGAGQTAIADDPIKTVDDEVQMLDIAAAQQLQRQTQGGGTESSTVTDPMATIPSSGRLAASSDHLRVASASASASPVVSQAQTPRRSPAPRHQVQVAPRNVLVLERTALSTDRPPAFMRFAPNSAAAPPAPTTFGEIREELRLETVLRRQAAAIQNRTHMGAGESNSAASMASTRGTQSNQHHQHTKFGNGGGSSSAAATTVHRRKTKAEQEEAEEVLLRQRMKAEEQKAIVLAAMRVKEEHQLTESRHRAARVIQRCYRRWWHRFGYNASLLRKKERKAAAPASQGNTKSSTPAASGAPSSPPRGGRTGTTSNTLITGGGRRHPHTTLSRAVVRCAQKWLKFCLKRLLLFRLSGRGGNESRLRVERNIRMVQRCWRSKLARRRADQLRSFRTETEQRITVAEAKHRAARRIQGAYRCFQARRDVVARSRDRYWRPVVHIQRWFRWHVGRRAKAGQRAQGMYYQTRAAVAIQRVWRGYLGRLRAVMLRLKQKVNAMRAKESSRSVAIQRIAKGYQTRRALAKATSSNSAMLRSNIISSLATRPPPTPATRLPPQPASEIYKAKALQQAASVEALRDRERDEHHIPVAVESQAARHRQEYTRLVPLEVRRERAAEMDRRDVELTTLQRHRAARTIQKFFRRWKRLCTAEAAGRRAIASMSYERTMIQKRGAKAAQTTDQQKLRAINDLGSDARSLAEQSRVEAQELEAHVIRHHPTLASSREPDTRAADAQEVKKREVQLHHEQHTDIASLRALPTFLTQRQRKLAVQQRGEAQDVERIAAAPEAAA
jgi:hypothetical protein